MVLFEIDKPADMSQKKTLSQIEYQNLSQNPKSNSTFLIEINSLTAQIKANKAYILVPSTYQKGMEGSFILTASFDTEFFIQDMRETIFKYKQRSKGQFEKSLNI